MRFPWAIEKNATRVMALNNVSFLFCLFVVAISWAAPAAYGGSQARGLMGAVRPSPEPQQCRIRAASATYTTAHGNAGSLTH